MSAPAPVVSALQTVPTKDGSKTEQAHKSQPVEPLSQPAKRDQPQPAQPPPPQQPTQQPASDKLVDSQEPVADEKQARKDALRLKYNASNRNLLSKVRDLAALCSSKSLS